MPHILIVDDSSSDRKLLETIVERIGHSFESLDDGMHVLETVIKQRPDLIFLDIMMEMKEGIQTLYELQDGYADIPVVMVSAAADIYGEQAISLGAKEALQKPLRLDTIKAIIEQYIQD